MKLLKLFSLAKQSWTFVYLVTSHLQTITDEPISCCESHLLARFQQKHCNRAPYLLSFKSGNTREKLPAEALVPNIKVIVITLIVCETRFYYVAPVDL